MAKRVRAPSRFKYRKRVRKYKRKYGRYRRYRSLHTPLPKKMLAKLKYYTFVDLNPALAGVAGHLFRANSVYDPDFTAVGHQPRGFDQIMPMYEHFTVIKSKISAFPINVPTTTTARGYMYGLTLQNSLTGLTAGAAEGGTNVCEYPKVKFTALPTTYTNRLKTLKLSYSPKKFLGISKPLSEDTIKGTDSSNPTEDVGFGLYMWAESSFDPESIRFVVYLEYVVVFTEPRQPLES